MKLTESGINKPGSVATFSMWWSVFLLIDFLTSCLVTNRDSVDTNSLW